jgi:hypothetical protein
MWKLQNMRIGEKNLMIIKRHWIVYVMVFLYFLFWCITSVSVFVILWANALAWIINVVFWLFYSVFLFIQWLNHELDMYIITNNRVIWVEQISFLNRTVSECNLSQVQEVNAKTSWFFANILNYWTLSIQTAWNKTTLKMGFSPDSIQTARKILNIVQTFNEKQKWKN